jgi:hypothetical protein
MMMQRSTTLNTDFHAEQLTARGDASILTSGFWHRNLLSNTDSIKLKQEKIVD